MCLCNRVDERRCARNVSRYCVAETMFPASAWIANERVVHVTRGVLPPLPPQYLRPRAQTLSCSSNRIRLHPSREDDPHDFIEAPSMVPTSCKTLAGRWDEGQESKSRSESASRKRCRHTETQERGQRSGRAGERARGRAVDGRRHLAWMLTLGGCCAVR